MLFNQMKTVAATAVALVSLAAAGVFVPAGGPGTTACQGSATGQARGGRCGSRGRWPRDASFARIP